MTTDAISFDPFDPAQQPRHHTAMAELRDTCPVARLESGVAIVSRYDDVRAALTDPRFRNSHAARGPGVEVPPEDQLFFFEHDPPEHGLLRHAVVDLFSRQRTEAMAPAIAVLATELLHPLVTAGGGEMVSGFSVPFAGRLMMQVAGFPEEDAPRWRAWIRDMVLSRFSFTNRNERGAGFAAAYPDVLAYLDEKIAERERAADPPDGDPPDDVLTRVVTARLDGEPLSVDHRRMILFSVVSAGTNTLVNFISNTLLTLAGRPDLLPALAADRTLVPAAVEESLRRDSPSMYLIRKCPHGAEVAGTQFAEGERVLLGLASANRDETVYPDAETFRLDRQDQPAHLAFGWGAHLCLGAPIARQAGVTLLEILLDHIAGIELEPGTAPAPYLSPQGNGIDELHVRLAATA